MLRVLVCCEFSGTVRDAFTARGHDAWSCDLLPTDSPGNHFQGDCFEIAYDLLQGWDLIIWHPPCTHLASSGARHFKEKRADGRQQQGIDFFMRCVNAPCDRMAIENPVGIMSSVYRKPDQIIQPWQFGHPESKATCLWLKGLPALTPAKICEPVFRKNPDGTDAVDSKGKRYNQSHNTPGARFSKSGYEQKMFRLPPTKDRWKLRSITYQGIATAMAEQWG